MHQLPLIPIPPGGIKLPAVGFYVPHRPDIVLIDNCHIVDLAAVASQGVDFPHKVVAGGIQAAFGGIGPAGMVAGVTVGNGGWIVIVRAGGEQ